MTAAHFPLLQTKDGEYFASGYQDGVLRRTNQSERGFGEQ